MKILNTTKTIFETIVTAIIFVVMPIIVFTLFTSKTDTFGYKSFTVLSGSMEPLIPTGSIVYTQAANQIFTGDIITFKRGDVNITHRVIGVVDKDGKNVSQFASPISGGKTGEVFYKTKGDANNVSDKDLVAKKDIIGKAYIHLPAIGKFSAFIKSVPGFLLFIIFPALIFISFELFNIKQEIEKETEKRIRERLNLY